MKITILISLILLGLVGLAFDVLNFVGWAAALGFGFFGAIVGVVTGFLKILVPIVAFEQYRKSALIGAGGFLLWVCLVGMSTYNTASFFEKSSIQKIENDDFKLQNKNIIDAINEQDSEIKKATENRDNIAPNYTKAIREANKQISEMQDKKNALTDKLDLIKNEFVGNGLKVGWVFGAFLELLTVFASLAFTLYKNDDEKIIKGELIKSEINNKTDSQDNSQILLIQLLNNISDKLNSIEKTQNAFPLPAPVVSSTTTPLQSYNDTTKTTTTPCTTTVVPCTTNALQYDTEKKNVGDSELSMDEKKKIILSNNGKKTYSELSKQLNLSNSTISRILKANKKLTLVK